MKDLDIAVRQEIERLKDASVQLPMLKDEYLNQGYGVFALWMNLSGFSDDDEYAIIDEMQNYCTSW